MFDLTLQQANIIFNIANIALVGGAALVLMGTIAAIWTSGIRDRFASERISINEAQTARANAEAADAKARTAEAKLKLEELRIQIVKQGSRSNLLYGERRNLLVERLKPFAGQKAEVRICDELLRQHSFDKEAETVATLLQYILSAESKWSVNPLVMMINCGGEGLFVTINSKAPDSTRRAADALLKALKEVPIIGVGDTVGISDAPRLSQHPSFEVLSPLGVDAIVVTVYAHPL